MIYFCQAVFLNISKLAALCLALTVTIMPQIAPASCADEGVSVAEIVRNGFYSFSDSIDIREYEILPSELTSLVSGVIKDDPYLFFVSGSMSYSYERDGYVVALKPEYYLCGEEAFFAWECCREWVREIAKEADKLKTDARKALYIHDAICFMTEYDPTLESDDMYDLVNGGRATCQGYTAAYLAVLRECGIESHFVASDSIEHIWNYVKIDGKWYHADLTWDDSVSGVGVSRRHFLLSDRAAEEKGHRDWYSSVDIVCDSEDFLECDFDLLLHSRFELGDVDHDCFLTLADLLLLSRCGEICQACADINGDGVLDDSDKELIRQKLIFSD